MSKSRLPANKSAPRADTPAKPSVAALSAASGSASLFPTETEIYLLPDGRVIVADLPAELAEVVRALGVTSSAEGDLADAVAQHPLADSAARPAPNEGSPS